MSASLRAGSEDISTLLVPVVCACQWNYGAMPILTNPYPTVVTDGCEVWC